MLSRVLAVVTTCLLLLPAAQAGIIMIDVTDNGGDLVLTGSGTIDTTGFVSSEGSTSGFNSYGSVSGNYWIGVQGSYWAWALTDSATALFGGSSAGSFAMTGDDFGFWGAHFFYTNPNYVSGSLINFTWTIAGLDEDFAQPNYGTIATFGNNSVVLREGGSVPEPATLAMLGLGLIGLWGSRRLT